MDVLEEFSVLPTGRRIHTLPIEGRLIATNVIGLPVPLPTGERIVPTVGYIHSTNDVCHDIDIEGIAKLSMVAGDDELYIQCYYYHISID
jgi:hypothetical protein